MLVLMEFTRHSIFLNFLKSSYLYPICKSDKREELTSYRSTSIQSEITKLSDQLITNSLGIEGSHTY